MGFKSFIGLNKKKKKQGVEFDSLFGDIEEIEKSNDKTIYNNKSYYSNDEEDIFTDSKNKGFYGINNSNDNSKENEQDLRIKSHIFNFSWWEYAIIFIEFVLLIYVILLFFGVFKI